jgi:hypothetical protein
VLAAKEAKVAVALQRKVWLDINSLENKNQQSHPHTNFSAMFNIHNKSFLLVIKSHQDEQELQTEVKLLEQLLPKATRLEAIAQCTEIADLNRYRLISKSDKVQQSLRSFSPDKAFVFLICRN